MKELHLVCNAHIDPVWQWEWEEGIAAAFSTFNSAANLADKYDYIFCHNEAILYQYIEKYAPVLFEKIRRLVKIGKWRIIGGWYLQPDCTMLSGESFVRQIGYGKRYFKEKFGAEPKVALNVDSFGHTRGLVQILVKTGYTGYFHCRPNNSQFPLPCGEYLWKGFDDSLIKVARRFDYSSALGKVDKKLQTYLRTDGQDDTVMLGSSENTEKVEVGDYQVMFWGVGNHGGGPSDNDLAYLKTAAESSKDVKILHSTPESFFEKINPTLIVDRSLYISMPGCYTSMSTVKHKHREVENLLYSTEKMASICALNGLAEYPSEGFKTACEDLMTAQFHDTLPGTVIEKGEQNALMLLEHAKEELVKIRTQCFFAFTVNQKRADNGEYPIFVYNFSPYKRFTSVEVEFSLADQNWSDKFGVVRVYRGNEEIACQQIKEDSNLTGLDWRKKIVFDAYLEPLSINRFNLIISFEHVKKVVPEQKFSYSDEQKTIDIGSDGLLKSYRANGVDYIDNGFGLYAYEDNSDPWGMCAEYQKSVGKNAVPFTPLTEEECAAFCNDENAKNNVRVIEDGKIIKRIESYFKYNDSFARLEYTIYKNHPYTDIKVDLYNIEKDKMIRLHFPIKPRAEKLFGDTAFGTDELFVDGRENVAQKFVYIKSGNEYFAVINDGTYGSNFVDGTFCQSLLRSAAYCAHPLPDRPLLSTDRYTERIDMGKRSFSFRIFGGKDPDCIPKLAQEFAERPFALNLFPLGDDNQAYKTVRLSNDNIILVTLKKSEEENGFIIRLQNNSSKEQYSSIKIFDIEKELHFLKYEVKTLLYLSDSVSEQKFMSI